MKILDMLTGSAAAIVVAGAAGGAVNWLTRRARWTDGLIQIFVGGICAYYLSPVAIPVLTPVLGNIVATSDQIERLSGFVIGLGGVSVSGFVMDIWTQRRALLSARKDGANENA